MDKDDIGTIFEAIVGFFNTRIFTLGNTVVTLWSLLYFMLSIILLVLISARFRDFLANRILQRYNIELGIRQSIASIIRYMILFFGLIIIFQTAGIDFTALGLVAGAFGVGIGLGLQGITNNFISGIILLFERPLKVGDRIEVITSKKTGRMGEFGLVQAKRRNEETVTIRGDVVKISSRATTIVTNDNISILIPNSDFVNSAVTNWSYNHDLVRLNIPVHVAHHEDPENIKKILLEIVSQNPGVKTNPTADVLFEEMGERSLVFNLRVWTNLYVHRPNVLKSQIYYAISQTFKEKNIEVPYPQRDLHIKTEPNGYFEKLVGEE